ncbi:glutamine synthetase [Ophiostoma piceae UAMH 11346]|uniref:Glutamine synthetase n=1 Tax=Ophiostoma piceae (strain UAMH 11346) TaxID=1262450 RepID=S3C5K2_OPHP1|nr:glutamine synthetase [Ophiostoma piceae UAMH 11346]
MHNTLEQRHENTDYAFAFKNLDWDAYHKYRPVYPPSMWMLWLDYHRRSGNGSFGMAHDIGSGPGTAALVLSRYFGHVAVSDAGAANLAAAKRSLQPPQQFTFHHGPGEQTADWLAAESIDFSTACMAMHYMDPDKTVRAVAVTLAPGGTLAAVTYGFRLLFPGHPRAQDLWYSACSRDTLRLMREKKLFPAAVRGLANAMTGLDFVSFPPDVYRDVRRFYVNIDQDDERPLCFVDRAELWHEAETRVTDGESREFFKDSNWGRQADAAWLRGFLASCQMGFDDTTWALPEWQELEAIVAAQPQKTIRIEWPVSMVLATKR